VASLRRGHSQTDGVSTVSRVGTTVTFDVDGLGIAVSGDWPEVAEGLRLDLLLRRLGTRLLRKRAQSLRYRGPDRPAGRLSSSP
jgi:hypothetical protein